MPDILRHRPSATELVRETAAMARLIPTPVLVSALISISIGSIIDTQITSSEGANALTIAVGLVQVLLQLWVVIAALDRLGLPRRGRARFFGLFLLGIPLTFGIGLGLMLLVVPGIYLAARWRIAVPLLIAEEDSLMAPLRKSWDATRDHIRPLMIATTLVGLPVAASFGAFWFTEEARGMGLLVLSIIANTLLYAGTVGGWLLDLAAYRLIANPRDALAETFA